MSSLPRKSVTGLPLKKYVLDTLNGLIDYCHTHRIKAGKGIDVRETASGYVIGLAQPPSNPPQVQSASGGGGADGIEASVTGGTASITLTGGTGSVNLVGTGSVTISGNTNTGNIEINSTGGTGVGFPNYANEVVSRGNVDIFGTTTYTYNYPVWLIGYVGAQSDENDQVRCSLSVVIGTSPNSERVYIADLNNDYTFIGSYTTFICMPIPANTPFYFLEGGHDTSLYMNELAIYPCL